MRTRAEQEIAESPTSVASMVPTWQVGEIRLRIDVHALSPVSWGVTCECGDMSSSVCTGCAARVIL